MSKSDKTLNKCDELIARLTELKKALNPVTHAPSNRKPINALGVGWSMDPSSGAFHHNTHGIISTSKHPEGHFEISHGGKLVGRAADMNGVGKKIIGYVKTLQPRDTGMRSINASNLGKEEGDVEKSGYGPKGSGQYSAVNNAKRKANNVGNERFGNQSVKAYSHKNVMTPKVPKGAAGPVKQYTPEQIAAINEANKLKKTAEGTPWVAHASVPNADEEVQKLVKVAPEKAESLIANQLANLMLGKAMLGNPPPQPTNEQLFGHLVQSEEQIAKAEQGWNGVFNNFLAEATKPISARFASEEEELAYWASIKVSDKDDGRSGY